MDNALDQTQPITDAAITRVLAIDLGTSGCKCAVVDLRGQILGWDFVPVVTNYVGHDGAEQNPEQWWQAFLQSAKAALQQAGDVSVDAICTSAQGEGTIAVDREGQVLHPALLWLDMRGRSAIRRRARAGMLRVAGYNPLKLARWIRLTGGAPSLSGKDPAAHMLYIRESLPEVYARTHRFLNVLDYFNFRLTGRMVATPDSIMTSWVTDNRNPQQIRYDDRLIKMLGVAREKLPEIVPATDIVGGLALETASALGLAPEIPIVAGGIDTSVAAIGSGAVEDGLAHLYIGSSSWIGAHVPWKRTDLFSQIASVPCARPDRYLMTALQSAAGVNLSFLRDQIFFNKDELGISLLQQEELPDVYRLLDQIAARVPAGARGLLYTPWLFGERTPVDDGNVRAGLLNLSLEHTREDMIRAVLEGVALNTRWMLGPVRRFLSGYAVDELTIVGGGGESDVWCQIFADVMNIRIKQMKDALHANLLGAGFLGGVGIGAMTFEEVPSRMKTKKIYEPQPEHRAIYDERFRHFCEAYQRLKPLYQKMNQSLHGTRQV